VTRERLQKVLASAGIASRRSGEDLIRAGRVTVDGRAGDPGRTGRSRDAARAGGRRAATRDRTPAFLLDGEQTCRSRLDRAGPPRGPNGHGVAAAERPSGGAPLSGRPVGRRVGGLLLFTNDGAWADLLLHPRYGVEREYMVGLVRSVTRQQKLALRNGIELEEGLARFDMLEDATPAQVRKLLDLLAPPHAELRWYRVVLAQGWKRQIRPHVRGGRPAGAAAPFGCESVRRS